MSCAEEALEGTLLLRLPKRLAALATSLVTMCSWQTALHHPSLAECRD